MRKGFDGLSLLVQEKLRRDPHNGYLFVFRGRRGSLIKVLWHDGQGMCLYAKRLERGRFIWPLGRRRDDDAIAGAAWLSARADRLAHAGTDLASASCRLGATD
jgi:transposase